MSEVFLGYDVREPRFVALKLPLERFRNDASAIGRLRREGEIYRTLRHPGVVDLIADGPLDGGGYYIVEEYLRGESLTETLDSIGGPMPLPQAMVILEDLSSALHAAHRAGIVHRDVQPENIMVAPDGRCKLFDFGIAKADDAHVHTVAGTLMGTLVYSSPEQRGGEPVDHRSDIFGVGAILYEMLTGRKAIEARTFEEVLDATTGDLPAPSRRNRDVPPMLDEICAKLLHDDPEQRYQDLRSMLVELGKLRLESDEETRQAVFGSRERRSIDDATAAFREGDIKKAQALLDEIQAADEGELAAEILHLTARIQEAQGRPDLAMRSFEKAAFHARDDLDLILDFAMFALRNKDADRASRTLDLVPGVSRGNLMVLGLLDAVRALPDAPPTAWQDPEEEKASGGFLGSIRSLFGKS